MHGESYIKLSKVLARKGAQGFHTTVSCGRAENVSLIAYCNAQGSPAG